MTFMPHHYLCPPDESGDYKVTVRGENGIADRKLRYAIAFRANWPHDASFLLHFSFIKMAIMTNLICTAIKRLHHINMNVRKVAHFILSVSCKHISSGCDRLVKR